MRNNFIKEILTIFIGLSVLSGCQSEKIIQISGDDVQRFQVTQRHETQTHPAQFYLCDYYHNYCEAVTELWSGKTIQYSKRKSKLLTKKSTEKQHENTAAKNHCLAK
jgi:hypothetical protein